MPDDAIDKGSFYHLKTTDNGNIQPPQILLAGHNARCRSALGTGNPIQVAQRSSQPAAPSGLRPNSLVISRRQRTDQHHRLYFRLM